MKESDDLQDIKHLVHSNAVQGEIQIGHFRFFVIFAALFMVLNDRQFYNSRQTRNQGNWWESGEI